MCRKSEFKIELNVVSFILNGLLVSWSCCRGAIFHLFENKLKYWQKRLELGLCIDKKKDVKQLVTET